MAERWRSYFCNVNGKLASIALDLSLRDAAPIERQPWLLWVWVYLCSPRPDGLSDRNEFDILGAIEDGLAKMIASNFGGVQCGRITTDGRREFYFYGAHDQKFRAAVKSIMRQFREYKFDADSQEDPNWKQYVSVLYPSDEDLRRIKNRDVLDVLREKGDQLSSVRDVHHWIYFHTTDAREWFASSVTRLGYRIESQSHRPGDARPLSLTITRDQSVGESEIDEAVLELFALAKQVDAEYDGWETQVVVTH